MRRFLRWLLWTLALGVPALAMALLLVAFLDENIPRLAAEVAQINIDIPTLANEFSARWPEVAGMVIGQLVIMILLLMSGSRLLQESTEAS
jgi:hypothetical protein